MSNEEKNINETVGGLDPFLTILVGLRSNPDFQLKTNVPDCNTGDFASALAAIELNMILQVFKAVDLEEVSKLLRMKEIAMLSSVRLLDDNGMPGLPAEKIAEIKKFFNIEEIERLIVEEKRKDEENKKQQEKQKSQAKPKDMNNMKKIDL